MTRKVIVDVDPGIDGAVALAMTLFDPRLEVVAVTAVAGNVSAEQATRNVQAIIEQLDPPRWPRIGKAVEPERSPAAGTAHLCGADGLGNAGFAVADLHHAHVSEKVIADEVRNAPDAVTILALGPLTNVCQAIRRDPNLAGQIGQLVICGGAVRVPGDATPAAEYSIYSDPLAAREVFRSRTTKTLVPLDVTTQVTMNFGHLDMLPSESSKVGRLLRRILPFAFRAYRQELGLEGIYLHDAVAVVAATHPELFTTQHLGGDVEVSGELTAGATILDRRRPPEWRGNMHVALEVDAVPVMDAILRALAVGEACDR